MPLEVRNFQSHEIINVASDRPSKLPTATGKRLILSRFARFTVFFFRITLLFSNCITHHEKQCGGQYKTLGIKKLLIPVGGGASDLLRSWVFLQGLPSELYF